MTLRLKNPHKNRRRLVIHPVLHMIIISRNRNIYERTFISITVVGLQHYAILSITNDP